VSEPASSKTDECPSCGWQAFVTYDKQRDSDGRVRALFPRAIRCTNPGCEHYDAADSTVASQSPPSKAARKSSKRRLRKRQRKAFKRREDEDAYAWVTRTHRKLRYRDLPRLLLIRNEDRKQVEAIQLLAQLKMVKWTRALTFGTLILGACTIVAAVIVRS
jgi:predicted  nucleic acid-binding Zn-ribbon protein